LAEGVFIFKFFRLDFSGHNPIFEYGCIGFVYLLQHLLRLAIGGLQRSGALFGSSPNEAFFVKCDGENNTAESIDLGMVIVEIGVAPVKPAEFVIFRLSQFSGGTSISD
jgi:hypothetical protein